MEEYMDHPSGSSETESVSEEESRNVGLVEMVDVYLKHSRKCVEVLQRMPSPTFNKEQCEYLAHKLEVVVDSAISCLEVWRAEQHASHSSAEMARAVETFKYLLALAKQIESFRQGCCKEMWIRAAMTLTNVSEYVSSLGFNLELCRVAFCKACVPTGTQLTLNQVDDINKAEVETVQVKASADVATLLSKVRSELNFLSGENRVVASYLLQRLLKLQPNPTSFTSGSNLWCVNDDGGFWGKWFKWVTPTERLGKGGSAVVHKATWLGTEVAKKTFQGRENPEFMKEVEILARLCHPNITSMFCSAKDKWSCSILMELMDEDLHDLMYSRLHGKSDSFPFTISEAVDIMLQIGEGVNYLHNKRIVHRDLKSMNILVKKVTTTELDVDVGYVQAKVADFGLSKTKNYSIRFSNQTLNTGTNRWMPPEIIDLYGVGDLGSTSTDERVPKYPFKGDVYSFGMVCYEILSGYEPFPNEMSLKKVKEMILNGERPNLPGHRPVELKELIEKCWKQVPEERPSFPIICSELRYLKCLLLMGSLPERKGEECTSLGKADYIDHGGHLLQDRKVLHDIDDVLGSFVATPKLEVPSSSRLLPSNFAIQAPPMSASSPGQLPNKVGSASASSYDDCSTGSLLRGSLEIVELYNDDQDKSTEDDLIELYNDDQDKSIEDNLSDVYNDDQDKSIEDNLSDVYNDDQDKSIEDNLSDDYNDDQDKSIEDNLSDDYNDDQDKSIEDNLSDVYNDDQDKSIEDNLSDVYNDDQDKSIEDNLSDVYNDDQDKSIEDNLSDVYNDDQDKSIEDNLIDD